MEYRTFTENDKNAIAVALMVFLREMDGKSRKSKTLVPIVEYALEGGLTIDELFNRQNWIRAASEINGLSPHDYVSLMLNQNILCKEIKQEDSWCDDLDNMALIAKCFHDFYITICPKGGTWSTDNARLNLEKAIRMHSLQALMSETAIMNANGRFYPQLTCFNYVLGVVRNSYNVENIKSENQVMKENRNNEFNIIERAISQEIEDEDNNIPSQQLRTEPEPEDEDNTIYPMDDMDTDNMWGQETETFVSMVNPREMKRNAILSILYNYMVDELNELIAIVPDVTTLADFVEKLTDGNIDTSNESIKAREIHQLMNGELLTSFITCIKMQGFDMTEELALSHDPLIEKWDFRDIKTRKAHKLKRLIYTYGSEDEDLQDCINDIEKFYLND